MTNRTCLDEVRVVLVSHGFQANYERGFCNGLAQAGAHATLISSDRTDRSGLDPRVRCVNLRGSQEESRPRRAKALNLFRYHFSLLLYSLLHRPDVLHVIGLIHPPWLCGVIEGLWFRLTCRSYVLTVHDLLPHDRHTWSNKLLFGWSFKLAHRLVVHTDRMKEALIHRHRISAQRIVVMEHGIEPLQGLAPAPSLVEQNATLHLLVFGKIMHYKGLDLLLEALRDIDLPFVLTVAGASADAALTAQLHQQIAQHPARSSITWANQFIPEEDIGRLFQTADALVLPYRHIDQSGVLFQALRWGLPVIATRVGAFEHYVTQEVGEVCRPEDALDLRRAIQRFAARRQQLSRSRIMDIGRSYEWPRVVLALDAAYR